MIRGANYTNYRLILNDEGTVVALQIDGEVKFRLGDVVTVRPDSSGYICPGITSTGIGQITEIRKEGNDYVVGIKMATARESGCVKISQIALFPYG